jgi:hypothetical protein
MGLPQLDNLVRIRQLKAESPTQAEMGGLTSSGNARLKDARVQTLSLDSLFDLAYKLRTPFLSQRFGGTGTARSIAIPYSSASSTPSGFHRSSGACWIRLTESGTLQSTKDIWRLTRTSSML